MSSRVGNVYFAKPIGMDGPIKIGCSHTPATRLDHLAAWSPWPLEIIGHVPGSFDDEMYLHRCFSKSHTHREWFQSTPALRDMIQKILIAGSIQPARDELQPTGSIRPMRHASQEQRSRTSYGHRIRWAEKRLRALNESGAWCEPDDVSWIMYRWRGSNLDKIAATTPSASEFARLEEYLADPATHSVVPSWRRAVAA